MSMQGLKKLSARVRNNSVIGHNSQSFDSRAHESAAHEDNRTLFQGFEWYCPSDGQHWNRLSQILPTLKLLGVDQVWLPPGCKSGWQGSNGYDVYDQYDLGEFDQKGHIQTKWGDKITLMDLSRVAQRIGIGLCWDAVLNHRCSADYTEKCKAVKVDKEDRNKVIGSEHEIEAWTGFDFAGRAGKYSSVKYHWYHFTGTDWEANLKTTDCLYRFTGAGKAGWAKDVDDGLGNYDYLMGNDLDLSHKEVRADLDAWGEWITKEVGLLGFRLDAVKHMSQSFLKEWISKLDAKFQKRLFFVGEYWRGDLDVLGPVIEKFSGRLHLFDVELAGNMSRISHDPAHADFRTIFEGTLTKHYPEQAVTFVLNHDTQPRYERDHHVVPIQLWFIPLGYALILLRDTPSYPCVFYGDLYGTQSPDPKDATHQAQPPSCLGVLPRLMLARKLWAYGPSREYFDHKSCAGFTRQGIQGMDKYGKGAGLAVVLNIDNAYAWKKLYVGKEHSGEIWADLLEFAWGTVSIDGEGWGNFPVGPRMVGVWVSREVLQEKAVNETLLQLKGIHI